MLYIVSNSSHGLEIFSGNSEELDLLFLQSSAVFEEILDPRDVMVSFLAKWIQPGVGYDDNPTTLFGALSVFWHSRADLFNFDFEIVQADDSWFAGYGR